MKFETVNGLKDEQFCRLTGVKRTTFNKMLEILKELIEERKASISRKRSYV